MDEDKIVEKVIEESVKSTVGKIIEGITKFFGVICMPAAEEFGLYLKDRVALYRLRNIQNVILKTQNRLKNYQGKSSNEVSPKLIKTIIDESSWNDDKTLQDMWAGLLLGAVICNEKHDDSIIYVNQLKELSSYQARIINLIYSDYRIGSFKDPIKITKPLIRLSNKLEYPISRILDLSPTPLNYIYAKHSHNDIIKNKNHWSFALEFIHPQLDSLERYSLIHSWEETQNNTLIFQASVNGLDLHMHCCGYKYYPLDAYLVIRRHWANQKGIDPLNWKPSNQK
ncbi:MAG: DUF4393 domain-containing protein [Spirochaetes bacterium]|nr:DUF4393 domain-containing protein [Spirochaetota bacterium]